MRITPTAGAASVPEKPGLLELIRSDYATATLWRTGSPRAIDTVLAPVRFLLTSSLRAALLFRLAAIGPKGTYWFWRSLLIGFHSSEVMRGATIGRGIRLPHPFGITIADQVVVGDDVTISQHVTLGSDLKYSGQPIVEDGVTVLPGAVVAGPVRIGTGAVIGANAVVLEDVEADGVATAASTIIARRSSPPRPEQGS